jgi:mRNA-degrading endonuclease YafQ of YafQ-DinJ toxin-antitoxin module
MFDVRLEKYAFKKLRKLLKKNLSLQSKIHLAFDRLGANPFDPPLNTHKVNSKNFGFKYSSSITPDLRFIWDFDESTQELEIIEILDIGGYSGSRGVY